MKKILPVLFLVVLIALSVLAADIVPRVYRETEVSDIVVANEKLEMVQFTSLNLYWTFKDSARPLILNTNDIPAFEYAPTSSAWHVIVTGSVENAAQGRVKFSILPANVNTNGVFGFNVYVTATDGSVLSRTRGDFTLWARAGQGVTNGLTSVIGMGVTGTWVDKNSITNVQTFLYGALTGWTTNGVSH
jgi:opacity protein-like surface antigen